MSFSASVDGPWFYPAFVGTWVLGAFLVVSHLITRWSLDVDAVRRRAAQLDEEQVIAAFQERRRRWLWMSGTPLYVGIGFIALILFGRPLLAMAGVLRQEIPGVDPEVWLAVGMALFAWGFLSTLVFYRCPVCDDIMVGADRIRFNPLACHTCGARLRPR